MLVKPDTSASFRLGQIKTHSLDQETYLERAAALQKTLVAISQAYLFTRDRAIILFEGWDAAGKGGTIRLMTSVLDPRGHKVWPIAAPTPEEQQRHYLYRFWTRLPEPGTIAVFDRSWYGRVLVERVDALAEERAWRRAYEEINAFERMLVDDGVRLIKLFLHITRDEQRKRFKKRLLNPMKRWKLTYEDLRAHGKWAAYEAAVEDMLHKTSTAAAPWTVLPANDKKYARIMALERITEVLAKDVDLRPRPLDPDLARAAHEVLGFEVPAEAVQS